MRRSFGSGGGSCGSSAMIKSFQRAVRAAAGVCATAPEPFSPASANNTTTITNLNSRKPTLFGKKQPISPGAGLMLSSSSSNGSNSNSTGEASVCSSVINFPAAASSSTCSDESDWEHVDGSEGEIECGFRDDFISGTAPSQVEVEHAVSALQHTLVLAPHNEEITSKDVDEVAYSDMSSDESELNWVEPSLQFSDSRKLVQPHGSDVVYTAFHLLQTEPQIQRMVTALSSDRAVWDAVFSNYVVKEIRDSIVQVDSNKGTGECSSDSKPSKDGLRWIMANAKKKLMQLIDAFAKLLNEAFQAPNDEYVRDSHESKSFEEKLKVSLLLSFVVLLIVVVARARGA